MKRIAIVVTSLTGSGAEKVALTQAELFQENGHQVVLFLLDNVKKYDTNDYNFPIIPLTKGKNVYKVFGKFGDFIYAKILQSKMDKFGKFDMILSNLPRADRVVKRLKYSKKYFVIHTSYKAELEKFNWVRAVKKLKLYRYLYQDEKIIVVAKNIIDDFDELHIKYAQATTIYNPFFVDEIRTKGNEVIDIPYEYIISPSAFRAEKRYDVMLDAFKMVRHNVKLLILAKKDPKIEEMIRSRGLEERVVVLGFQQNPYKYIKNAKLLILSSDREGLPTVVIESLILGIPVVSTDCPTGPREILIDELSRWLVPVANPVELAQRIEEALDSDISIQEKYIEKFDKENIYEKFVQLWEN